MHEPMQPIPARSPAVKCAIVACLALLGPAASGEVRAQATTTAPGRVPQTRPASPAGLAARVPSNVALFLQARGMVSGPAPASSPGLTAGVLDLVRARVTGNALVGSGLPELFASAVGLDDPVTVRVLFAAPLAVAADGWSGLSDAIFLSSPPDAAALEARFARTHRPLATSPGLRRYALGNGHELACDGRVVIIGRAKKTSLYTRTLELLERGGPALADQPEFVERTAGLSSESQLVVFVGRSGGAEGQNPLAAWWPDTWPRIKTVSLGLVWGRQGPLVRVSARLDPEGPALTRSEPPIQVIRRLPASVLAAWTQAVDYVGDVRRLQARLATDPEGFRLAALEAGLEPGAIESRLLRHLVGDTVFVIDQVVVRPVEAREQAEQLILPGAGLLVETDDPDAVAGALPVLVSNLVKLLEGPRRPEPGVAPTQELLSPGGPVIYSVPVGRLLDGKSRCDFLEALELSWTVVDRWVIVGGSRGTVRRLAEARRGAGPLLDIGDLDQTVERVAERGGQPRRVMYARPRGCGLMIDSWLAHVGRHHREMLEPQWWDNLLRRRRAMGKQMGILGRADSGTVEVVDALPDGPARDLLKPGDRILSVDGATLDAANPLRSLRELVAGRSRDQVVLVVRRGEVRQQVAITMPREYADDGLRSPVELLKRLADASRLFGSASYVLWQPKPDVVDIQIDFRVGAATQPAATQPAATRPAASRGADASHSSPGAPR
jgi:hypothetical protein